MTATHAPAAPPASDERRSSPPRVGLLIAGSLAALLAVGLLLAGGTALYLDTQRDRAGYVATDTTTYSTGTYALVSDSYQAGRAGDVLVPADVLGTIRVRARSAKPVFIGIAPAAAVDRYLAGVAREQVNGFDRHRAATDVIRGGAPATAPGAQRFWTASASGAGSRAVRWRPRHGDWRVVVMNADGSGAVTADVAIGAKLPHIVAIGLALAAAGLLVGGGAALLIRAGLRGG